MAQRPAHVKPPAHLSKSPPVPQPEEVTPQPGLPGKNGLDPARYGDWEHGDHGGRIVDF